MGLKIGLALILAVAIPVVVGSLVWLVGSLLERIRPGWDWHMSDEALRDKRYERERKRRRRRLARQHWREIEDLFDEIERRERQSVPYTGPAYGPTRNPWEDEDEDEVPF